MKYWHLCGASIVPAFKVSAWSLATVQLATRTQRIFRKRITIDGSLLMTAGHFTFDTTRGEGGAGRRLFMGGKITSDTLQRLLVAEGAGA